MRYTLTSKTYFAPHKSTNQVLAKLNSIKAEIATVTFSFGESKHITKQKELKLFRLLGREEACRWYINKGII